MKKYIFPLAIMVLVLSCSAPVKEDAAEPASTVTMPYTATYSSQYDQSVSDQDVLAVLNSYKAWENGDMAALRASFGDSLTYNSWDGTMNVGLAETTTSMWAAFRDSLSSVKIEMAAWAGLHSVDKNVNFVNVWYKEVDTYKSGKKDSADWHDFNVVANGKIIYYAQYRRPFKIK
jgi:ketosteroid isomerase-like protein